MPSPESPSPENSLPWRYAEAHAAARRDPEAF